MPSTRFVIEIFFRNEGGSVEVWINGYGNGEECHVAKRVSLLSNAV